MKHTTGWAGVASGAAAFAVGLLVGSLDPRVEPAISQREPAASLCAGGVQNPLRMHAKLADHGSLEVEVESELPASAGFLYGVEFVDDRGASLVPPAIAEPGQLAGRRTISLPLATLRSSPDGYYQVRVTAVAAHETVSAAEISTTYFRVSGGLPEAISPEEWISLSRARLGTQLPSAL